MITRMPMLDVEQMTEGLTPDESKLVRAAIWKGHLRTAKPFRKRPCTMFQGQANYVWRMLCFSYCNWSPYCCMPVTADFDIPVQPYDKRREITQALDDICKRAEKNLPLQLQRGTMAWGKAFGLI